MATFKLVKSGCLIVVIVFSTLVTSGQLHTDFTATPLSGCSPLVVSFTDISTGNPTQWKWDLGNGTISFLQNPSVTYFTPGQYTIKLVIRNANGRDSLVRQQYVSVFSEPAVHFTSNVQNGCFPLPVHFTDSSGVGTGSIVQWQWDFGDGQNSTLQNPIHTYTNSGNYNVSLRVTNSAGCSKAYTQLQYIQIFSGVTASFSHQSPNSCLPPVNINFQNTSTGTGGRQLFGDWCENEAVTPENICIYCN